jgi:hypothetical protein
MTEQVVKPLAFFEAVKHVILFYFHVYRHIIGLVVLASLAQAIVSLLMPENPTVGLAISVLDAIVSMFFYGWIIDRADIVLMNRQETTHDALKVAKRTFLPLMGVLGIYVFLMFVLTLFGFGMQILGTTFHGVSLFALITLLIAIFILMLFAFSMPAVVLDSLPVIKSFERSAKLVWGHWWRTFGVTAIFVIPIILLSLLVWSLSNSIWTLSLLEFIYHLIVYPLMVSLVLVLYYDLKARYQMLGFKRIIQRP